MINIGAAIVLAAILFLIDKNEKWSVVWRYSKRIVAVLAVGLLVFGIYLAYENAERKAQAKAEAEAYDAQRAQQQREYEQQQEQKQREKEQRLAEEAAKEKQRAVEAKQEAERRAKAQENARVEHARRIPFVQLFEVWRHNIYGNYNWLSDIQITNETPEVIKSITLAVTGADGEQPRYVRFSILIEPERFSFFSKGHGATNTATNCATDLNDGLSDCGYTLGVPTMTNAEKMQRTLTIKVVDFEGAQ